MTKEEFKKIVKDYYQAMPKRGQTNFAMYCNEVYFKKLINGVKLKFCYFENEENLIEESFIFWFEDEYTQIKRKYDDEYEEEDEEIYKDKYIGKNANTKRTTFETISWKDVEKNEPETFQGWYFMMRTTIEI